jgi:hypothetical protein
MYYRELLYHRLPRHSYYMPRMKCRDHGFLREIGKKRSRMTETSSASFLIGTRHSPKRSLAPANRDCHKNSRAPLFVIAFERREKGRRPSKAFQATASTTTRVSSNRSWPRVGLSLAVVCRREERMLVRPSDRKLVHSQAKDAKFGPYQRSMPTTDHTIPSYPSSFTLL